MFNKRFIIVCLMVVCTFCFACKGAAEEEEKLTDTSKNGDWVGDADPVQTKLKQRGEQATRALGYQKEVKEKLAVELPVIELFTRDTVEKDAVAKLGKPSSVKDIKLEGTEQKVFYYNESNFALWFWRTENNTGPYQYRAAISLKEGKFDVPLHNVFDEAELKQVQSVFEEKN